MPHVAFLGRIPRTNRFSDLERHPDNETVSGVLIFRVEAALLYFNVDHILQVVLERIHGSTPGLKLVICDLSNAAFIDLAGARMLIRLHDELKASNIGLRLVEAHASQRDILRAEGLEQICGPIERNISVNDVLAEFSRTNQKGSS
jgi:sulfate permease, SulP family